MKRLHVAAVVALALLGGCGNGITRQEIVSLSPDQIARTKNKVAGVSQFAGLPLNELYGMRKIRNGREELFACGRFGSEDYFSYNLTDDHLLYIPDIAAGRLANDWGGRLSSDCSRTGTKFTPAPVNAGAEVNQA